MAEATLREERDGIVALVGVLNFGSVPPIWERLRQIIRRDSSVTLSLREVRQSNSAALALLLEAVGLARACSHRLVLEDVPQNLVELAELSNVTSLLGVARND